MEQLNEKKVIVLSKDMYRDKTLGICSIPSKTSRHSREEIYDNLFHSMDDYSVTGYFTHDLLKIYNEHTRYDRYIDSFEDLPLSKFPIIYLLIYLMTPHRVISDNKPDSYYSSKNYKLINGSEISWECCSKDDMFESILSLSYSIQFFKALWN